MNRRQTDGCFSRGTVAVFTFLILAFASLNNASVWASTGSVGGFLYIDNDAEHWGPIYNWIDITATGTEITGGADHSSEVLGPYQMGFNFPFAGQSYSAFYITTDGTIQFSSPTVGVTTTVPNSPFGPAIFVLNANLQWSNAGGTRVYYQYLSVQNCMVISFVQVGLSGGPYGTTMQAILYSSGDFQLQYSTLNGVSGAIGAQQDSTTGLPYAGTKADGRAILYSYPASGLTNGDFETGNFTGWTVSSFLNNGLSGNEPFSGASITRGTGGIVTSQVVQAAAPETGEDPQLGPSATLKFPKFGTYSARVGDTTINQNANSLSQTFKVDSSMVDPNDNLVHVRFAYAPVLQNPVHADAEQPYFYVGARNRSRNNGVVWESLIFSGVTGSAGAIWKVSPLASDVLYSDWRMADVVMPSSVVGDVLQIEAIGAGCSPSAHYGYVYVDGFGFKPPGLFPEGKADKTIVNGDGSETITYTFDVINGGSAQADGVTASFTMPAQTAYVSSGGSGTLSFDPQSQMLTVALGTMAASSSASYHCTVSVNAGATGSISAGNYNVQATGTSPFHGPVVDVAVRGQATDLAASASVSPQIFASTDNLTYTFTATNNGTVDAAGCKLTCTLPANVTFVSASASQGSVVGTDTITASLGTLAASASATLTVVVQPAGQQSVTCSATASGDFSDTNTANDSASATADPSLPPPNSGAEGVPNIAPTGDPGWVSNPLDGFGMEVASSNGGVIVLALDDAGLINRSAYDASTNFLGIGQATVQGGATVPSYSPACKFTASSLYVADASLFPAGDTTTRKGHGRLTLAVSQREIDGTTNYDPATDFSRKITPKSLRGKLDLSGAAKARADSVTFTGMIELPVGLKLPSRTSSRAVETMDLAVGIGNIIDHLAVDSRGRTINKSKGDAGNVKSVSVRFPKADRKSGLTFGTTKQRLATVTVTLSNRAFVANGFDTEGVSGTPKANTLKIQTAIVLAGITYQNRVTTGIKVGKKRGTPDNVSLTQTRAQ